MIGGHVHLRCGPTPVEGDNRETGYTFTAGRTGGAAYAVAVGSKPRRQAETTPITYRDGRPVGMQLVVLQPEAVRRGGLHVAGVRRGGCRAADRADRADGPTGADGADGSGAVGGWRRRGDGGAVTRPLSVNQRVSCGGRTHMRNRADAA